MQTIKKALSFLMRLLVVDVILLICTYVSNLALVIKGYLAPYALSMKTSDIVNLDKVNDKIIEIQEDVFVVQSDHRKQVDNVISAIEDKFDKHINSANPRLQAVRS